MTTFAMVGAGWRAEFFWRLAAALPSVDCVGAVVRTPRPLPVPAFGSLADASPGHARLRRHRCPTVGDTRAGA